MKKYRIIRIRNLSTTVAEFYTKEFAESVWKKLKKEVEKKDEENYLIAASFDVWDEELRMYIQEEHLMFKVEVLKSPEI